MKIINWSSLILTCITFKCFAEELLTNHIDNAVVLSIMLCFLVFVTYQAFKNE